MFFVQQNRLVELTIMTANRVICQIISLVHYIIEFEECTIIISEKSVEKLRPNSFFTGTKRHLEKMIREFLSLVQP
jgi:hypothetical protein